MKTWKLLAALLTSMVLLSILPQCHSQSPYTGDGRLTDSGSLAATDRYVLDLGPIELNKQGSFTYRLQNLPSVSFVIGIEIHLLSQDHVTMESHTVNPNLFIELVGPQAESLIRNESFLSTWTWSIVAQSSRAFVYRRDEPSTAFIPIRNKKYELRIKVVRPDESRLQYSARLIAKSGGWK